MSMKSPALSLYAYKNFNRALKRTFKPYATYIVSVRISDKEKNMSELLDNRTCPTVGYQAATVAKTLVVKKVGIEYLPRIHTSSSLRLRTNGA